MKWNRENFSNYYEIFLDANLSLVKKRDPKNLYRNSKLTVPEVKTYEIKDEVTGEVYLLRKKPVLKKSIVYCTKRKENVVVWVNWHVNQTPEYTYRVDSYKNYLERTWIPYMC